MEAAGRRYVGIDLGKRTYTPAIIGKKGAVTLSNGTTTLEGRIALYKKLEKTDRVAVEAGNPAFEMAKETGKRVGCETVVPNPAKLAIIYASVKKTDREDALKLARLISIYKDEQLPGVPVPGDKETGRRKIIAAYNRAKQDRTRKINLPHGLFLHQGITHIVKKDLATAGKREDAVLLLKGFEKKESEYVLKVIDLAEKRLEGLKKEMD
ncbi:hypothetical protein FACS1894190_08110 [Spirochaetia bacterium]|nr:hypothetical protein FACS1894190_08110 [Spirochaetia bacterium]